MTSVRSSVSARLLMPLLLLGALGAACGPDLPSVPDTTPTTAAEPLIIPREQPSRAEWMVEPDKNVAWMLAGNADLSVTLRSSPTGAIALNTNFDLIVDISNVGPNAADPQTVMTITLPTQASFQSVNAPAPFSCGQAANVWTCRNFTPWAVNSSATITFRMRSPNTENVLLQTSATISSASTDPTPGNNASANELVVGNNDAPTMTAPPPVPAIATPEDVEIIFSTATGRRVSVADPDAFNRPVRLSMDVQNGATRGFLSLSGTAGLSFLQGDGNMDANMAFEGTITAINAALEGMRFTPAPNFYGPTSITLSVLDLGNSGLGSARSVARIINISVSPEVNDPPDAVDDTFAVPGDSVDYPLDVLANDTWLPDPVETLTVSAVTQPANGTVTFTATGVKFTPTVGFRGTTTFTYTIDDGHGAQDTATVTCTVGSPNSPPTATNDSYTVTEDSSATTLFVLSNDSTAPDANEILTITALTQPVGGTVSILSGNSVRFTPSANIFGTLTFTYTISDGRGGTATATVTVTVTAVNDPPTATNDTVSVVEDTPTTLDVLANDSSAPDGPETLTITSVTQPVQGTVTFTGANVRYTPPADYNGPASFTYTISDGNGGTATGTVNVTVTPVNDPPVATADSITVVEDSATTVVNVLANDTTGPETGETLSVTAVTQPATGGAVTLTSGVVRFTPTPNFFGTTTFTYTISDGNGGTATATVTVTVTPVNDPPDAVNDSLTVGANTSNNVLDVLANDTSAPDGPETLTVTAVTQPATGGTVTLSSGVVSFTPTADFRGTVTFTYTISDGNGGTDTATVTVVVGNNPPVANADSYTVPEDSANTTFDVLANDTIAPDTGETLFITSTTQPAGGTVVNTGANLRFTPTANFHGTTTFTYTVSDGNGGSATATVTVTVTPVNDPPDAINDTATVNRNSAPTVVDVLANDTYLPDAPETLTITGVTQPTTGGSVTFTPVNVSFTPSLNFTGTVTFTYTISDGNGGTDTATVTVTVVQVNLPPVAADDTFTVAEDSAVATFDVLANDTFAPDTGETLTITNATQPSTGGTVTFNTANVRFTPAANFNGTVTFQYTISDGNGGTATATVTVNVTSVNDPPDAVNDSFSVTENSSSNPLDVLANDTTTPDTGETLTVQSVTQPASGTVTLTAGVVRYTPPAGFNGTVTFTYTVSDGNGGSDTATVTVTVTPVNDPPTANNDNFTVAEDSTATKLNVLANDTTAPDTGETLTITAVTQPANGTVTFTGTDVSFTPAPNFTGTTTFQYTVSDGNGGTATATVTVTVDPVNDPPTATNDTLTVAEDSSATAVDVLTNDSTAPDTGETLTVQSVTQPANGTVTLTGGVVRFTPAPNFNGTTTFQYTVSDGNGGTATASVTVTVTPVNDTPDAVDDTFTVAEDSSATVLDVLANDSLNGDVGETLTVTAVTQPATGGTVTLTGGVVRFTPTANFVGTTTFQYTISDGNGGTDTATVTLTVIPVGDPPDAVDDVVTVAEDSGPTVVDVLANDTTLPDTGETLSITAVTQPANGSVTFTPGQVRFTPAANFFGTTSFTYTVSDGNGGTDTATVTVTVTPVNDAPTANDDTVTVAEDSGPTVVDVLANDTFLPDASETLTITAVTPPAQGTVTFTASNVSFTPAADFNGTVTFTYRIQDGNGGTATATVTVNVTTVNDPPDAVNDTLTVAEDSAATVVNVLTNDTFAPDTGETLTVQSVTQPANGTVTLVGGVVSFTPAANFNGTTTFQYTVSDGNGGTDTATVTVTVTPVNDPPTANNDNFTVPENSGPSTFDVLANDTAVPDTGETLTITTATQPSTGGTVSFTATGVTFIPTPGYVGPATFTYTISDGNGGTATATVTVDVSNQNDPPTANDDAFTVAEDSGPTPMNVLANDTTLPDTGETLTITAVTQPAQGTVSFTASDVTFTPAPNFFGTVTFSYTVSDGNNGADTASVTVTVTPVNDPPTALDDSFTVGEDSVATVLNVLANDTTAPEFDETLTITAATQPANGTTTFTGTSVSFTPAANFHGGTTFQYTVSDGNGGTATATVTVNVTPVNDPPDAVNDAFTVDESSTDNVLDVLANDSTLPDTGETLTVASVTQPASGTVTLTGGVVRYTPPAGFNGTVTFSYTVSDGSGGFDTASVTVTVTSINDPPTASDDTFTVAEDSAATSLDVLANDTTAPDTGETLTITAVTQPATGGTVTFTASNVELTPTPDFNGTVTFTYTVSDGNGGTDTANVTVNVTPVNDPPTAADDTFTVAEDSGASVFDVLLNDSSAPDTGETLTIASATQPVGGTVTFTASNLTFTPAPDFNGTTSFTYRIQDGNGGSATATVTVTVTPVNDAPTANDDVFTVAEDSGASTLDVLFNDNSAPDTAETLTVQSVTQPANGSVTLTSGVVSFTPALNFFGTTSFTYTVTDDSGSSDTATVLVNVTPVNDPPTANNDSFLVPKDSTAQPLDVLANDSSVPDVGETLVITSVTQPPSGGSVTFTGSNVSFTPTAGFEGVVTFTYTISDGNGGSTSATVTVLVGTSNRPPTANDDSYTVAEDSGATVLDVLANDTFAPDTGETLTVASVTQPASGTVTSTASSVSFTPAANFHGTVSFSYTVSDGNGGTDTATVTVTVTPVNDPPTATNDSFTVAEDSAATVLDVLTNDTVVPDTGESLTVTAVTQPANGAVTLIGGVVRYTPPANFSGPTTFQYTISDGNGGTATATVTVNVTPVNDPPTAANDSYSVAEDSTGTDLDVLANDTFAPDTGETLTVTGVTQPTNGSVTFTPTNVNFTPAANFHGTTTFRYTVSDGNGGTATGTVTVTVTPVNDPPTATDDSYTVAVDSGATAFDVLFNDTFAPDTGETLTVVSTTQPANGSVTLTGGVVRFTPAAGFSGTTTFQYTISDGSLQATGTVTVTVTGGNIPPTAGNDSYTVAEDSGATAFDVLANDSTAPDTGETLTITSVSQPAGGTVTFTASNVSFTPAANFNGTTTFQYTVSDGNTGTATATVTVTVTPVNDPPTLGDDSYTVAEDSGATSLDVLANDTFAPDTGETLTITAVTQPPNGAATIVAGAVRFTPAANFHGTTSFTYTVSDGNGGSSTATVTVVVTPVNDPPNAMDDNASILEDFPLTLVGVQGNDTTAPDTGETITITAVTQPANGTVTLTGGLVRFAPAPNFFGTTTFTYTISDGNGGTDTATVRMTVIPVNDPPTANDDSYLVAVNSSARVLDVLLNDTYLPDAPETLTITAVTQAPNGAVSLVGGVVRFTPMPDFSGTTSFTYTISDGNGGEDTGTVTVNVSGTNSPPDAVDDSYTVAEDSGATVFDVLTNDTTLPDTGETLTVVSVTQPPDGTVTLVGGVVSFTPAPDFNGTTSFLYTVSDGNGTESARVTVTVTPENDPPDAVDDSFVVTVNSPARTLDVLSNDTAAPDTGETLTITAVTQPANGTVTFTPSGVSFEPTAGFTGTTTFTYTISDGNGGTDTATVTVSVTGTGNLPTANDDSFIVTRNSPAQVLNVLANDTTLPDTGETLTVVSVTQPANGTVTLSGGVVSFTPATDFTGVTTFTYTVSDGVDGNDTAIVTVTVTGPNNPPDAVDDAVTVAEDSVANTVNVLANDTTLPDTGETLTVTAVTQPANGQVTLIGGVVRFTPTADFNGTTTFQYTVSDGRGGSDTATVTVTVTPVNDPPNAVNDTFTVVKDSGANVLNVLLNDMFTPDTGETLTVTAVTQPATGGSVTLSGGVVSFAPTAGYTGTTTFTYTISDGNSGSDTATVTVIVSDTANNPPDAVDDTLSVPEDSVAAVLDVLANDTALPDTGETLTVVSTTQPAIGTVTLTSGVVRFTPPADFNGTTTFQYTISDGRGGSDTATVTVTVTPVNDPPNAVNDTFTVVKDSGANVLNVLLNDTFTPDTGETLTVTAVTQPATGGTVTLSGGVVSFTPTAGYTGPSTFDYTISDGNGGSDTATVTVNVSDTPNNPPDAVDDAVTVAEDSAATVVNVLANDSTAPDTGETLTVVSTTQPANGTVTLSGGVVSFTPNANFNGTTSFDYTISDGRGGTDTATVTVTVTPVNDPPTAVDDTFTVVKNSAANVLNVLLNDTFAPDTGETLTVTAVTQPATGGTVTLSGGVVSFTPTAGYTGPSTFDYTISDGNGGSDTATVTVNVSDTANTDPTANDDTFTVLEDSGATTLNVLANDTALPDTNETLSVVSTTQPANGTVVLTSGVVTFTPNANFNGTTSFSYTVSDGNGGSDTATVTVTVTPVNDDPTGVADTYTIDGSQGASTLDVLANDSSAPDTGETLTVSAVTQPATGGTVAIATGGTAVIFTPTAGFAGTANFTYTVSDGNGGTDVVNVTVIVTQSPVLDTDGDGLPDALENTTGTSPTDDDTDDDGLKDGTEDANRDGNVDTGETNPREFDTDNDELGDGQERGRATPEGEGTNGSIFKPDEDPSTTTDPLNADTDGDGLEDGAEDASQNGHVDSTETDPNDPDTDNGGASDGAEVAGGTNPLDDSDDFIIAGSGCASTGTSLMPLLLLLGLPLLRRRRAAGGSHLASRVGAWGVLGVLAVLVAAPAKAQPTISTSPTSEKIDVQQYKPGPGAYDVLGLHSAQVGKHLGWNLGLSVNYAKDPLTFLDPRENAVVYKLVENQLTVDVMGAIALFDRFEIGLALPITSQTSQSSPTLAPLFAEGVGKTGLGDVRVVPKASLYSTGGLSLGAAMPIHLPTGGDAGFLGGGFSVRPKVLGEWNSSGGARVLANVGLNLRSKQQLRNLVVSNELTYGIGAEVPFRVGANQLSAGGTLMGAMGLGQKGSEEKPLEVLATVRYRISDAIAAHLGGGPGLTQGYGTPGFRVFAGLAYVAPAPKAEPKPEPKVEPKPEPKVEPKTTVEVIPPPQVVDTDGDGIKDDKDGCPQVAEDKDGFQDEDGCEDTDNDADGLTDASDKCPNEPEAKNGFQDEDGCADVAPPVDTDGDGLTDDKDRCPQAAEDKDGFEDTDGCPDPDNDHDGVADADDKCPNQPETINGVKDDDGCPDKGKVKVLVEGEKIVILEKIFFANGKATILPKSFPLLRQVAQVLRANPQIEKLRVEGHTDDKGDDGANLVLSRTRAEAVRDRLTLEGINGDRLEAVGYGEAKPIASNKTAKGREQNRRVEFTVVKMKAKEVEVEQP